MPFCCAPPFGLTTIHRHYWDWINTATKPSGKITFSGLKVIAHTPAQVKEAHKAINTALDTHFSLKPTPGTAPCLQRASNNH